MLFKKKKPTDTRRVRQPAAPGGSAAQPVFSYHARSARTEPTGNRLLWAASTAAKAPSPRRDQRSMPRRVLVVSGAVLAVALVLNSLFLGRDPKIVEADSAAGSRLLLRSQEVYREASRTILASSLTNTNKLTIDTGRVARAMQEKFPELAHVSVVLPVIGRQPTLYVQPVHPALLLKSPDGGIFIIDDKGRAVMSAAQVPKISELGLVVIEDQSGLPIAPGRSALTTGNVAFITEVIGQLKAKGVSVVAMVLPAGTSELDLRVEGAPYIVKFNLRGDARAEAGAFLGVKQHLERENIIPSTYIDVRVDNRAYYR